MRAAGPQRRPAPPPPSPLPLTPACPATVKLAVRAALFSAVGTAGQRCTSLRRLYVHEAAYDEVLDNLTRAYSSVKIGNPLEDGVLCGPLHNEQAVANFEDGVRRLKEQGGKVRPAPGAPSAARPCAAPHRVCLRASASQIVTGGKKLDGPGYFVEPTISETPLDAPIVKVGAYCRPRGARACGAYTLSPRVLWRRRKSSRPFST